MILKNNSLPGGNIKNSGNIQVTNGGECTSGSVETTLKVIGGKWKPMILYHLTFGTRRFGEIGARIPSISRKVLAEQLKELENDKLIEKKSYKEIPPRVEYQLTDLGRSLLVQIIELGDWASNHSNQILEARKRFDAREHGVVEAALV